MLRSRGRATVYGLGLAVLLAGFRMSPAQAPRPMHWPTDDFVEVHDLDSTPRTFSGTGFEASEGYGLGSLSTALGWRCLDPNVAFPPTGLGPRCPGTPDASNVFRNVDGSPAGVVPLGNHSSQSLFLSQNFKYPNGANIGNRSPTFDSYSSTTLNIDIMIDDDGGANYELVPQSPLQGNITGWVSFYYTGYVYVNDCPGPTGLPIPIPFDTNRWYTFQFYFDYANGQIHYSMGSDKNHLQLLHTGCVFAGTQVEEVLLYSDNYQNLGGGAPSGRARGPGAYIDNIEFYSAPPNFCECVGDVDALGTPNGRDIQGFLDCLLYGSTASGNCTCADMDNFDGTRLDDIPAFVNAVLSQSCY